tara:strand:+ start:40242 stop:41120 length:879 start_codon:yes stop_codon:yes gene_type:complete
MTGLSICIPVYNFNCINSVKILIEQIQKLYLKAEILVIDDASTIKLNNLASFKNQNYTYERLAINIGRAKIRNLLVKKAKFNYILFIDGDSGIPKNFIENYVPIIKKQPDTIICGGRIHFKPLIRKKKLRYNYGTKFEEKLSLIRNQRPYHSFMTNNFVSPKRILEKTPFNEELTKYGHEDTFFGYDLKKNNVNIIHMDNPIIHLDIDTNKEYIKKIKCSIENLILLKSKCPEFVEHSKLLTLITNYSILRLKATKKSSNFLSKFFEIITKQTSSTYSFQLFKLFYTISFYK